MCLEAFLQLSKKLDVLQDEVAKSELPFSLAQPHFLYQVLEATVFGCFVPMNYLRVLFQKVELGEALTFSTWFV